MSRISMQDYARLGESLGGAYATYREKGLRNRTPEEVQQYTPEQLAAYEQNYASTGDVGEMNPTGLQYQPAGENAQREQIAPQTQYRLGGLTQAQQFTPEQARAQNEADIREQWKSQGTYGEDRRRNEDEIGLRGLQTDNLKNELGVKKEEQAVLKAAKSPEAFLKFLNDQYQDDNDYVMHKDANGITHFIQDNKDGKPVSAAKFKDWEDDGISQVLQYAPKLAADSWKMRQDQRNKLAQIEATKKGELAVANVRAGANAGFDRLPEKEKLFFTGLERRAAADSARIGKLQDQTMEADEAGAARIQAEIDTIRKGLSRTNSAMRDFTKKHKILEDAQADMLYGDEQKSIPSREEVLAKINQLPPEKRAAALAQYEAATGGSAAGKEAVVQSPAGLTYGQKAAAARREMILGAPGRARAEREAEMARARGLYTGR